MKCASRRRCYLQFLQSELFPRGQQVNGVILYLGSCVVRYSHYPDDSNPKGQDPRQCRAGRKMRSSNINVDLHHSLLTQISKLLQPSLQQIQSFPLLWVSHIKGSVIQIPRLPTTVSMLSVTRVETIHPSSIPLSLHLPASRKTCSLPFLVDRDSRLIREGVDEGRYSCEWYE